MKTLLITLSLALLGACANQAPQHASTVAQRAVASTISADCLSQAVGEDARLVRSLEESRYDWVAVYTKGSSRRVHVSYVGLDEEENCEIRAAEGIGGADERTPAQVLGDAVGEMCGLPANQGVVTFHGGRNPYIMFAGAHVCLDYALSVRDGRLVCTDSPCRRPPSP